MAISVIIPVYNCAEWLSGCLDSVLQFDIVAEVIVIDDGSTDASSDIIKSYERDDGRIQAYTHDERANLGRSASRNLGIKKATQDWIAFLDADDYYLPNRFDGIELGTNADGYYGVIRTNYEHSIGNRYFPQKQTGIMSRVAPNELYTFLTNRSDQYFSLISFLVKKSAIETVGGFDESLEVGEDTDLIWRLAATFRLKPIFGYDPIAVRRIHENNSHHQLINKAAFYKKWIDSPPHPVSYKTKKRLISTYLDYSIAHRKRSWLQKKILTYWWLLLRTS